MFSSKSLRSNYCPISFLLLLSFVSLAGIAKDSEDPFVVVMLIKNEESQICQALDPYVREGLHSFLIYDAYSTDNTVEVLKDYFRQHNIRHGHIVQGPFDSNRVTQNKALELAEEYFPQATFLLIADVDWKLHNLSKLRQFCREEKQSDIDSYLVLSYLRDLENYEIAYYRTLLIRAHAQVRFEGLDMWEYITSNAKVPRDVYFARQVPGVFPFKDIFREK